MQGKYKGTPLWGNGGQDPSFQWTLGPGQHSLGLGGPWWLGWHSTSPILGCVHPASTEVPSPTSPVG